jgi:hypothetical protein
MPELWQPPDHEAYVGHQFADWTRRSEDAGFEGYDLLR